MMRHALVLAALALPLLAAPAFADCKADIRAVMERSITSGPYRVETKAEAGSMGVNSVIETVPPGDMHSRSMVDGEAVEMILIGQRAWMLMDGQWNELPAEMASGMAMVMSVDGLAQLDQMTGEVCGMGEWDGAPALAYSFVNKGEGFELRTELLVDPESGLPHEMRNITVMDGVESRSVSRYSYDASITIEAPL